ncbi:glutamine synthetase family protein (plasmid) [Aggregatilineales bacterium SYSU G02658]
MNMAIRDFLELPYEQLEELNLGFKQQRKDRVPMDTIREERLKFLADNKGIKAVTICFADLEGRLHLLDYDKKFLLKSYDNLTFDGSSIRGFSVLSESDLRLGVDWSAFYLLPSDVFGPGKVMVFGEVQERSGEPYHADMRGLLKRYANAVYEQHGYTMNVANEIEGFLFKGLHAEQEYAKTGKFEFLSEGGYYHTLPGDGIRVFIDAVAEAQRAMGFENEKDHPEVAPSQFEINYGYSEATIGADQIMLYKLTARQVARNMGLTASFLPKPVTGVNGSGMHTNMSVSDKDGKNLFHDPDGEDGISELAHNAIKRILNSALDICLVLNASVNAYRRLDPNYEAPNQIKSSPVDRGSMVRIPFGNHRSARIEVRSVAPDCNPYMAIYTLFKTALEGPLPTGRLNPNRTLPDNIYDAITFFTRSTRIKEMLGADVQSKYAELKLDAAHRSPRLLGDLIKVSEIQYHHEVYNQQLWKSF